MNMKPAGLSILFIPILVLLAFCSKAQNAHYWSSDYGPGGFLTPGAVIADNGDSGVFFYNPALLAKVKGAYASVSGNVYQYGNVKVKNGVGSGLDLVSANTNIIPLMAAGVVHFKRELPFTIGYALINTPIINYQTTQRQDGIYDVLNDSYSPGAETFIGQYSSQNSINQTSALLNVGFKANHRLSIGFTAEGQYYKQNYLQSASSRALINVPSDSVFQPIVNVQQSYQLNYSDIGFRFKGGLAYDISNNQHLGLLILSPLINIAGNATLTADYIINNLKFDTGVSNTYLLANARQANLKPTWKMPLSIALGYTYNYSRGEIYVAAEYFMKVNEYNIVTPNNSAFIRPENPATDSLTSSFVKMEDARGAVTNFALGVNYKLTPLITGYLALRTDFSYEKNSMYKDDQGYRPNTVTWNQYHLQLGANVKGRKSNLRTGLLFTYGSTNNYMQPVDYDNPKESNLLQGTPHITSASNFSVGLLLSYLHNF
jgi:hypothetical protein